jgi:Fe-S-cluster containining protein
VTDRELDAISSSIGSRSFAVAIKSHGRTLNYLRTKNNRCVFLANDGHCFIQDQKPLICRSSPLIYLRDGERIRWFISLHCPAAKYFAATSLSSAFKQADEEIQSWKSNWIQKLVSTGLLVEVGEILNKRGGEIIKLCGDEPERDLEINAHQGTFHQPSLGLRINLEARDLLWIDVKHKTYLEALLRVSPLFTPLKLIATELAYRFDSEEFADEFMNSGRAILDRLSIIKRENNWSGNRDSVLIEYNYLNKEQINGVRCFKVRDNILYIFIYESKVSEIGQNPISDFHEFYKRLGFAS